MDNTDETELMSDRTPLRRWLVRLSLLGAGTLLAVVLVELGLRAIGFEFHVRPQRIEFGYPDPEVMEKHFEAHERLLWVEPEYRGDLEAALEERPSWLLMGDSVTAWQRYDEWLVERLRRRGHELTYVNLAVPGWSTYQGLVQMRTDAVAIRPRVVTIYFGWNDHWIGFGVDDETAGRINRHVPWRLSESRIAQLAVKSALALDLASRPDSRPLRVSPDDFRSNLVAMIATARRHGMMPVLLTAATSHRRGHEPAKLAERWLEDLDDLVPLHRRYVGIVRDVAARQNAILCDLEAQFSRLPPAELDRQFWKDGIHLTPAGGRRVAAILDRCFDEHGVYELLWPSALGDAKR